MTIQGEQSLSYPGWRVTAAAAVAIALGPSTIQTFALGLFMRPLQAEYGWTRTEVALATTIVSLMVVVMSPIQGWLTDRFGVRRVVLPSIPAFACAVALLALLPKSLGLYYAAWVLIPMTAVGIFTLSYLKAVSSWFSARLGLALGIANAGTAVGGIVVPLFAGGLMAAYGWRTAAVGLGVLIVAVTLPAAVLFVRERPKDFAGDVPVLEGTPYGEAVRTPTFALLALVFLLVGATNIALITQQAPLLIDRGMAPLKAAVVMTNFGVFGLLGRLFTGFLLDRFRAPLVMAVFALGGALGCALYASGAGVQFAFVSSALIGLLFGAEFDVLAYIIKAEFGGLAFGKLYGTVFAAFQLGGGLGAAFLAASRDRFGGYGPGLTIFAAFLVAAAVLIQFVRARRMSEVEAALAQA